MDLLKELQNLVAALSQRGVDYAFCGAVALAIHGVPRATQDIDLLAEPKDLERIREVARSCGFIFEAMPMTFSSSGVSIIRFSKIIDKQPFMLDVLLAQGCPVSNPTRELIAIRLREMARLSRDVAPRPAVDMSAEAVAARLKMFASLSTMCWALGTIRREDTASS